MKKQALFPLGAAIATLFIYLLTVCPAVYVGDSGEIITAVYFLGIAHPPGYPLYMLIGKLFTYIPFGTIAFRVNLAAVFLGVASVLLLFFLVRNLAFMALKTGKDSITGNLLACSVLIFAAGKTFWFQSMMAKGGIYPLNLIFIILMLNLVLSLDASKLKTQFIAAGIICGLGLANHNTMAPLTVMFMCYMLWFTYKRDRLKTGSYFLIFSVLSVLTAVLVYLYLPIRSSTNPPIDWGHPANFTNFYNHVLRKQYALVSSAPRSSELFSNQLSYYTSSLVSQFTPFLIWLGIFGIRKCMKWNKPVSLVLLIIFLFTNLGFIYMINFQVTRLESYVIEVFFIPSYLIAFLWIMFGIFFFYEKVSDSGIKRFVPAASALLFIIPAASNYFECDLSRNYICHDYGIALIKTPEKNSILFTSGDNASFVTAYFKMVEKAREDLVIYDDYGRVFKNLYGIDSITDLAGNYTRTANETQRALINSSDRSVYCIAGGIISNMDDFKTAPVGFLYKVKKDKKKEPDITNSMRGIDDNSVYKDIWCKDIIAQYYYARGERLYYDGNKDRALIEYKKAEETGKGLNNITNLISIVYQKLSPESSLSTLEEAVNSNIRSVETYNNLAVAYFRAKRHDDAIAVLEKALQMDPNYAKAYYNLGVNYMAKIDYNLAERNLLKTIDINPSYTDAYYGLGNCYLFQNRFQNSLKYYRKTVELNPKFDRGWNGAGAALFSMGKIDESLVMYQKAVEINPEYAEAYQNIALVYYKKGDKNSAIRYLNKAVALDPNNMNARNILEGLKK